MSTSSINYLNSSYLQSLLTTALQGASQSTNSSSNLVKATSTLSPQDNGQLSPFAEILGTLQQLQQSNPTQYQQVTQQIATNLQSAAKTATADGNTAAASQLNQLATDFTNASTSGQLPNIQDLAQAIGGGGHHHHHGGHHHTTSGTNSDTSSSSSSATATGATTTGASTTGTSGLDQLLAAFQANATQNEALNPLSIIASTLASTGVSNLSSTAE